MGLIGLIGLMGCSSELSEEREKPEAGIAIIFSARQGEEGTITRGSHKEGTITRGSLKEGSITRAGQGLEEVLPDGKKVFKAWAYKNSGENYSNAQEVMKDYTVRWVASTAHTTSSNSDDWEYVNQQAGGQPEQTIKYWDWSATAYRFFGMAGGSGTYGANEANGAYTFTIAVDASSQLAIDDIAYYSKMWFSTGNPTYYPTRQFGRSVQLEFVKPIARVRFMFIYENPEDEGVTTLSGKRFAPPSGNVIHQDGTVTVTYPLTGATTTEDYEVVQGTSGISYFDQDYYETPNDVFARKWYYVLPTPSIGQGAYTLTVMVNGVEKTAVVPAAYMNWLPGYQYTYIFKVHVDGGVSIDSVQSAFTPWHTEELGNHAVFNW